MPASLPFSPSLSPAVLEHRRHCEEYTAAVVELCRYDPAARRALRQGRGRPLEDCAVMHRYLARHTAGQRSRRVHYTLASLIAAVDPLDDIRAAWPAPPPGSRPQTSPHPDAAPSSPAQLPAPTVAQQASRSVPASRAHQSPAPAPAGGAEQGHNPTTPRDNQDNRDGRGAGPGTRSGTAEDRWSTAGWRARPNLGAALASAVHRSGFHAEHTGDLLHVLLKVGEDQLQRRLPSVMGRLLRAGAVPDWPVLLDDLIEYRFRPARVALRWQDGFYLTTPDSQPGDLR